MSHLQFFLEIGKHSQASQQDLSVLLPSIVYSQAAKTVHFHAIEVLGTGVNERHAFFYRKERLFARIAQYRDNDFSKLSAAAFDNVKVS